MDKRQIKRLVIIILVSIGIIMLAKYMLTKTITNVNNAAVVKKQAVVVPPPVEIDSSEIPETAAASADAGGVAGSGVEGTASSLSEADKVINVTY